MKKQLKVVLIEQTGVKDCISGNILKSMSGDVEISRGKYPDDQHWEPQHMYLISEDRIKEGEQYINKDNCIYKCYIAAGHEEDRKIVAATTKSLNLPQISPADIQWWTEAGCPETVEVQMEENHLHITRGIEQWVPVTENGYVQIVKPFRNPISINEDMINAGVNVPRWTDTDMLNAYEGGWYDKNSDNPCDPEEWLLQYKSEHHV